MKLLYTLGLSSLLLLQACETGGQRALKHIDDGDGIAFGKIQVLDEKGRDISEHCKVFHTHIGDHNLVIQEVDPGASTLKNIQCSYGRYQYYIDVRGLTFVSKANTATYFGNVRFILSPTHSYNVKVDDRMDEATQLLASHSLPLEKSLVNVGDKGRWGKSFKGKHY